MYFRVSGLKLAADRVNPAQQTQIGTCRNSCSPDSSSSVGIKYSGAFIKSNKLKVIKVLEFDSSTSQNGLMKLSKLVLKLASSVNDRRFDRFLKLSTTNHGFLPNFPDCFKTVKVIRSFTVEEVFGRYLTNDFKTVSHISKDCLIETMYLMYINTLIKRQISLIQLSDVLLKRNWKALRRLKVMITSMQVILIARVMNAIKPGSSPTISWKSKEIDEKQFLFARRCIARNPGLQ